MTNPDIQATTADPSEMLPFEGYRIVDFTQVISGPLAVQLLNNSGASVIKVEAGSGDQMRKIFKTDKQAADEDSPAFAAANRGKRSLCVDLKSDSGLQAVKRVISQCDVVVENFRPGVAERLGLGYETVRRLRDDINYCSVSGFGHGGPLSGQGAYDGGIQAVSGMMSTTGHPETGPVRTGYLAVDVPTALHTAYAISSALLRRERTGQGQWLDVAMLDTALLVQVAATTKYLHDQTDTVLAGNSSPAHSPLANTFQTQDGYIAASAVTARHARAALKVLGLPETYWDDYAANPAGSEAVSRIDEAVAAAFREQTAEFWEPRLRATGLSVERVNKIDQALNVVRHQQRPIIDASDGQSAAVSERGYLGATFRASEGGPKPTGLAPAIGQHTTEVLTEFGFAPEEIADLKASGAVS